MTITAEQEKWLVGSAPTQLFIGGEWRDASGGDTLGSAPRGPRMAARSPVVT